jgi:type IV secretion system protein VirB10
LLSTVLAFGGNLARSPDGDRTYGDVVGDTVAQESSRVGQRIVERELSVRPTIKLAQGTIVNVLVNKDMVLAPY